LQVRRGYPLRVVFLGFAHPVDGCLANATGLRRAAPG